MLALSLFFIFCVIACLGVPLMYALLATTLGMILIAGMSYPVETILLTFISGVEPFILIAVPLFIFTGELLSKGGVGKRIVDFTQTLLGFLPGGLGVVTCVSCLLFGGVSGSAIADTAAIGSLVIPMMKRKGYAAAFAAALLSVAGTLALLMPLSIPFLVYAFIAGVSMRQLSMAGIGPALISALALMAVCMWYGRKTGCDAGGRMSSMKEIWTAFKAASSAPAYAGDHRRRHLVGYLHPDRSGGHCRCLWSDNFNLCVPRHRLEGYSAAFCSKPFRPAPRSCWLSAPRVAFPGC